MTKSQKRLLDKLRLIPAEDLTDDDREDLAELEEIEKAENEKPKEETKNDDLSDLKKGMEEILKCLKPQTPQKTDKVEIPTPQPVITNQDLQDQENPPVESKLKKVLKSLW